MYLVENIDQIHHLYNKSKNSNVSYKYNRMEYYSIKFWEMLIGSRLKISKIYSIVNYMLFDLSKCSIKNVVSYHCLIGGPFYVSIIFNIIIFFVCL